MRINTIDSTPDLVSQAYNTMDRNLSVLRNRLCRPMTLAEKILLSHLANPKTQDLIPGQSYMLLHPDRVALQDVTGQMALLQFIQGGRDRVAAPTTVHCDHLIQARAGATPDLVQALLENSEVYTFLRNASAKYGIGFWEPGAGIIHQVILENYAFPGGLMIGTDSHTPNAGGLGMEAIGVGGADAADVMSGLPLEVKYPLRIGVLLTGELTGWTSPKDIICHLAGVLTVSGGTNAIIEYIGPGTQSISCTGKATIANMGAELGATCSIFPFDNRMDTYLRSTGRAKLADLAKSNTHILTADPEVAENPERYFDRIVQIDLTSLEPQVVGPHTPDLVRPISSMASAVTKEGYPERIANALIGSCTNSSYEDMSRAADIAKQAQAHGMKARTSLMVTPGSEQIRATIERDGLTNTLESIGATVLANACGPCIGQWRRQDVQAGEHNAIVTSFNRNFPRRNDGQAETMNFIASPEMVVAYSLAGNLTFNPITDYLTAPDGSTFKLQPPGQAPEVPPTGFSVGKAYYVPPPEEGHEIQIVVDPKSNRLQLLEPFQAWDGADFVELPLLLKAKGKCTTDHISPAGPWLRFRGHLDNLSDNTFLGAVNSFTGETGKGLNQGTGESEQPFHQIARDYNARGLRWVAVGDRNYGEGSSREHAAMSPRLLGVAAVITRTFARIHESNLKKQGVLPLTFDDPNDYDKIQERDSISILGLKGLAPGKPVTGCLHHADGSKDTICLRHTFNVSQISWFRAGSALNFLREQ
jgi:aconitate hydratase